MKKSALYLILLTLFATKSFGQAEASNWYFGENAGIRFNIYNGQISALADGRLYTREGCASISNSDGELLFYTDGSTVYNASHQIMQNGQGLLGDTSSTQSAIVVPIPENPDIYYIFTVGSNQTNTGLNYSVVDMSANGGTGEVISKNSNLLPNCAEKISAVVKDCETRSIWVVTFSTPNGLFVNPFEINTFYAYEVNATGVNPVPVKSTLPISIFDSRGYLKLSPSGLKMACANAISGLYLFDFESETGIVSNPLPLGINNPNDKPYGVEFSPDSNLLYVTSSNDYFNREDPRQNEDPLNHNSILLQYDLNAPDISNSQIILDSRNLYRGALQLGPNGKIYHALSATYDTGINNLGAINNPNSIGLSANYQHNVIDLGTNRSSQGLPPFIASFFDQKIDIIRNGNESNFLALCVGESYTLVADDILGATYKWTKDGNPLPENDLDLEVTEPGIYRVVIEPPGNDVLVNNCGFPKGEARVEVFEHPEAFDVSLSQCDLDLSSFGITVYNLTEAFDIISNNPEEITISFHKSVNDAINGVNPILNMESYENSVPNEILHTRVVHNLSGCYSTGTLTLEISNTQVPIYRATPVCDEVNSPDGINLFNLEPYVTEIAANLNIQLDQIHVTFYETWNDALLEINAITEYENKIPYREILYYRVDTSNNDCYGINEVELMVERLPNIVKEDTSFYCLNEYPGTTPINAGLINGSPDDYTYLWSTGETSFEIGINEIGTYSVTVTTQAGCSDVRTITIEPSNTATIENIDITDASTNNMVGITVSGEGIYEFALVNSENKIIRPYQKGNVFENVPPGLYSVYIKDIKNDCGFIEEPISVIGFPKFFTPNNDGVNDTWQVYGVSELFQPNTKIFIYNRYGKLIKELNPLGEGWNGSIRGKRLPNDDYWFSVELQDGRIFKNHFTLKH